jgi:hypothetical protein
MPSEIKRKKSFGSVAVDHLSPEPVDAFPPGLNIHISFEDALKLHLGLSQILGHLNGYDRSTRAGRRMAVNLCLYPKKKRMTINEGRVRRKKSPESKAPDEPIG